VRQPVENWLLQVQFGMQETIKRLMKSGLNDFMNTNERKQWVMKHPGQVVSTISQIVWC